MEKWGLEWSGGDGVSCAQMCAAGEVADNASLWPDCAERGCFARKPGLYFVENSAPWRGFRVEGQDLN